MCSPPAPLPTSCSAIPRRSSRCSHTSPTTTDIIPIRGGAPMARGRTDVERLREGELVYTGALRTPVEAVAPTVPVRGHETNVSAEGFALVGDVHVWRGELAPSDYSVPTP